MSELTDLYQEMIVDHAKRPRNFGKPANANRQVDGYNPLCGDKLTLYLEVADGVIKAAGFQGSGCAISTASASLLTEAVKAKTVPEAETLFEHFHALVTGAPPPAGPRPDLGKLEVFAGVAEFPTRVKCASLAWHTLKSALDGSSQPVTTE